MMDRKQFLSGLAVGLGSLVSGLVQGNALPMSVEPVNVDTPATEPFVDVEPTPPSEWFVNRRPEQSTEALRREYNALFEEVHAPSLLGCDYGRDTVYTTRLGFDHRTDAMRYAFYSLPVMPKVVEEEVILYDEDEQAFGVFMVGSPSSQC